MPPQPANQSIVPQRKPTMGRYVGNARACLTSFLLLAVSQQPPAAAADGSTGTREVRPNELPGAQGLEEAIGAYTSGNVDPAISGLKAAQRAGLTISEAARAHYFLGLAYRKKGKPELAAAELTRALDERRGLSNAQRADAKSNQSAALLEASIRETTPAVASGAGKIDRVVSARQANRRAMTSALRQEPAASGWVGSTKVTVAPPDRLAKLATVYVTDGVAGASQPYVATPELSVRATAVAAPPPQPRSPAPNSAQPEVTATGRAAVRLRLAEVTSRNEAFALAVRLKSLRGGELAAQKLQISEVALDGGRTAYRLYLGPYATAEEAKATCISLRV